NEAEKGNEDDREDDKVGDAMLENKENNADHSSCVHDKEEKNSNKYSIDAILVKGKEDDREDEKVSEAMLDTEENNVVKGKEDDFVEDKVGEAVLYKEENNVEIDEEQMMDNVVELKRMRYPGKAYKSPYMKQGSTTLTIPKRRFKRINEELIMPIAFVADDEEIDIEEWTEGKKSFHKFPWGKYDIIANRQFWCPLLGYGGYQRRGWLMDEHLDLWVDLMWVFISSNADWAMAGLFFYFCLSIRQPSKSFGNRKWYPVAWSNVEKGTVTHIETDDEDRFKMVFIAFGVTIRSFLCFMRSLIIINAAHLKGTYLRTNLLAVGMYGNNQIIPIATGVSQGETIESWSWFLTQLKACIGEVSDLAIISDRHPAIINACNTIFLNAFHGAHCPTNRYNYLTSNSAESINALTRDVRKAPITKLMEYYRKLVQNWYCECRHKYEDAPKDELTDWTAKKVNNKMLKSANWQVDDIDQSKVYQVTGHRQVHTVDLIKGDALVANGYFRVYCMVTFAPCLELLV
nr:hypothetical protein [Tanacetum cinerariifolium]